jgi:hypothetical protein
MRDLTAERQARCRGAELPQSEGSSPPDALLVSTYRPIVIPAHEPFGIAATRLSIVSAAVVPHGP